MHDRLCVCGVEGMAKWVEPLFAAAGLKTLRKNTIDRQLFEKPDCHDRLDTVEEKRKASQWENQTRSSNM